MRPLSSISILNFVYKLALLYPTPIILSYLWNFGSLAGVALGVQLVTGIGLSFWYIPSVDLAFASVEFIMREVSGGWWLRYLHANGASLFFVVVYLHMARGLFYGSYTKPREKVWYSGVVIFVLMILTAFLGYVLPWGQMSYWAATVITSLLSVIPKVGNDLLIYVWGGISIDQPTLTRVYGLHFLLPFVLIGLVALHIMFLHEHGSNNPLGIEGVGGISFHPYYTYKDLLGVVVALFFYLFVVINLPNVLSHSDNYILADPGVTPTHIVPEWYFLPFYGILRSIPDKAGGVALLIAALVVLLFLPIFSKPPVRSGMFRPIFRYGFEVFVVVWLILGWSGGNPIESPFYEICQLATFLYFFFFLFFNPIVVWTEGRIVRMYGVGLLTQKLSLDVHRSICPSYFSYY